MDNVNDKLTQELKAALEKHLNDDVVSSIHMCVSSERDVVVAMEGKTTDMITLLSAALMQVHNKLVEDKVIPQMGYLEFLIKFYQLSAAQAKQHMTQKV